MTATITTKKSAQQNLTIHQINNQAAIHRQPMWREATCERRDQDLTCGTTMSRTRSRKAEHWVHPLVESINSELARNFTGANNMEVVT